MRYRDDSFIKTWTKDKDMAMKGEDSEGEENSEAE